MNVTNFTIKNNTELINFYDEYFPFIKLSHHKKFKKGVGDDLNEVIAYLQDFKYSDIHQQLPNVYKNELQNDEAKFESTKNEYSQAHSFLREKNIKLVLLLKSINTASSQNEKIITNINLIENYIQQLYNAK